MGARRRHLTSIPAIRHCSKEDAKTREQPINRGGRTGLRIIFSDEVGTMTERIDPIVVGQNAIQQGHRDWTCLQAAVWRLRHWRASVGWSIPAELLKILVFQSFTSTGLETTQNAEEANTCLLRPSNFFLSHYSLS